MALPALDKGDEPVDKEIHAELGGKEDCEGEVEHIESRAPVRVLEHVSDLRFNHADKEVLWQRHSKVVTLKINVRSRHECKLFSPRILKRQEFFV
jgi:hypothetical protein